MRLSEMNARLRYIQRVRRYRWTAVAMLAIAALGLAYILLVEDRMLAWLALALAPLGAAAAFQWWRDAYMPYLEFAACLAFGVLAAWGAIRTGHPGSAWQLFSAAVGAGGFVIYNARGR